MNLEQLIESIRKGVEKAGSQAAYAKMFDITPAQLSDILNGHRAPSKSVLEKLGLQRVVTYEKVK